MPADKLGDFKTRFIKRMRGHHEKDIAPKLQASFRLSVPLSDKLVMPAQSVARAIHTNCKSFAR